MYVNGGFGPRPAATSSFPKSTAEWGYGPRIALHAVRVSPRGCVTKISNYLLARPSRRRQRLPVQLWGQLQRPCRVLGAATDTWSLQRRYSAAMTRCGRARLAARATAIVSIMAVALAATMRLDLVARVLWGLPENIAADIGLVGLLALTIWPVSWGLYGLRHA